MSEIVTWRALQPCHVAGAYREAGEEFEAPDGDFDPAVRERITHGAPGVTPVKAKSKTNAAEAPGVTPEELFGGLPDA